MSKKFINLIIEGHEYFINKDLITYVHFEPMSFLKNRIAMAELLIYTKIEEFDENNKIIKDRYEVFGFDSDDEDEIKHMQEILKELKQD